MGWPLKVVLLLGLCAFATQDIAGRKGCDCSLCKGADNKLDGVVGKTGGGEGKSGCSLCEKRKEMLRMEREKQQKLQKCPFELLGAQAMRGKTSEEVFDEIRELVIPSQNGFFDMMRGVVRTMHGSSVVELQRAKEKEAQEFARKRAEAAKRAREEKRKDDVVKMAKPEAEQKVTVVVKQTPCGPVLPQGKDMTLFRRLPKEARPEEEVPEFQVLNGDPVDYLVLDSGEDFLPWTTAEPEENAPPTESPFFKFMSDEELKAQANGAPRGDFRLGFHDLGPLNPAGDFNDLGQLITD